LRKLMVVPLLLVACANGDEPMKAASGTSAATAGTDVLRLRARVVASFPHDPGAFTQGLLWFEGKLYESTGLWGASSIRRVDLRTGTVEKQADLSGRLFGEGLARIGRSLVQLTWQNRRAIRYDLQSFAPLTEHVYEGEGWGLCHDGVDVWRSDGSSSLWLHDQTTFAQQGRLEVRLRGEPVEQLNELECAEGWIYANVLGSDEIVRIDPGSGRVVAVIDASGLLGTNPGQRAGPLNGIAYRSESQTFLLTGKNWPKLFEVVFVEASG
jgi:glutaminyl-peptide cyclotransferase